MAAYVDGEVDRVEIFYNGYVSPLTQEVRRETLLPLQHATILEGGEHDVDERRRRRGRARRRPATRSSSTSPTRSEILQRLVPDYVEISIYRALLESTASEHGARMTAMRNASENAGEVIDDLTLEMNRARQAEITQEIMEVVAGAEALLVTRGERTMAATERDQDADEAQRRPDRGDPGRRDRGRLPRRAARDQQRDHDRAPSRPSEERGVATAPRQEILVCEVQQHLGDDRVRAVAMDTTDGLARGTEVIDTGGPITVPVGEITLGRIFNLLGETIDQGERDRGQGALADPPRRARRRGPHADDRDVRDRHQGRRPARALRQGRQGRPVRRRRRRQDGASSRS